ncbi:hypothetical protein ACFOUP_11125 [Belliella kenyensis]|uniref:Chaperone of endosialidase n=1 Tax=Belliella kenyensis TaxID=1472724 RepID=A0ABV8EPH3_9BACT|nr:hypothetical protein [Belliella kenyensis]MCH7403723.1 hypothetical protein [Belliella kenyensis]MDN3602488.1 hypothetical protein [Belliella kenyensis]
MKSKILLAVAASMFFAWQANAQTKVGDNPTSINGSAMLEIESANRGMLIPRVALSSTTVAAPVTSPANALTVFNTATVNDVSPGYYYWSASANRWVRLIDQLPNSWMIEGNEGTSSVSNFVGTTDNQSLALRSNNQIKAMVSKSPNNNLIVSSVPSYYEQFANKTDLQYFGGFNAVNTTFAVYTFLDNTGSFGWNGNRAGGTPENPTIPPANSLMSSTNGNIFNGTSFVPAARMRMHIDGTPSATSLPSKITFWTTAVGTTNIEERLTILNNGNVGMSISAPSERLDVNGNARVRSIFSNAGNQTTDRFVVADSDGVLKTLSAPNFVNLYNANGTLTSDRTVTMNNNQLRFNSGNGTSSRFFSIDQTSTDATLRNITYVAGGRSDLILQSGDAIISIYQDANAASQIVSEGTSTGMLIGTTSLTPVGFTTNDITRLEISPTGRVGIGTNNMLGNTNPAILLAVNGSILTTSSVYADYVFEDYFEGNSSLNKDYSFKSLGEIEEFINQNRHLPGIAKIDELQKNEKGEYIINQTELSIQLLEKIEELFLYSIEQERKMKALDAEMTKNKAEMISLQERIEKLERILLDQKYHNYD